MTKTSAYTQSTPDILDAVMGSIDLAGTPLTKLYVLNDLADAMALPRLISIIQSSVTTVPINLPSITPTALHYLIEGYCEFQNSNAALQCRVTTDGFTTVKSGASDYAWTTISRDYGVAADFVNIGDTADTLIKLSENGVNTANRRTYFRVKIVNAALTGFTGVEIEGIQHDSGDNLRRLLGGGEYHGSTAVVDGLQFFPSAGGFDLFRAKAYGLAGPS